MYEQKQLGELWSSTERTCLYMLQYKNTTKRYILQIHAFMLRNSLVNNKNLLAKFIATCSSIAIQRLNTSGHVSAGLIRHARKVFDHMPEREDTFISNTMMRAHLGIHQYDECLCLYKELRRNDGYKPDGYTFLTLAKMCTNLDVLGGQQVHDHVVKEGFGRNLYVLTSLVDMYAKLGRMECAKKVFDEMPDRSQVSWTALVGGYAKCGNIDNAKMFFGQMPEKDTAAYNAMIDAYVKVGDMGHASSLFNEMVEKNVVSWTSMVDGYCSHGDVVTARAFFDTMPVRNLVSWNAMIKGYYQNKQPNEALNLFQRLQAEASLEPDNVTIVSVLPAIADLGALDLGNWVHEFIIRKKMNKATNVCTALVDMYAKCGEFVKARKVFDSLVVKETATWNALIHGLAVNGYGKEAINVFLDMKKSGNKPNEITMTAVLSACNHSGLVNEGKKWFKKMEEFGISPKVEHYGCMIDLLGRAGYLEEAETVMDSMPFEVNDIILSSFLSACNYAKDVERAERILNKTYGKACNDGNYITLRNLYATDKRWVDVEQVQGLMRIKKAKKEVGCSVIEAGGKMWGFASGDRWHPQWRGINSTLEMLLIHMKKAYLTNVDL
ncbi:pentatricopeptide repeat-containing protein At2g44880 [Rutidosis leptorrhynchoides]|uniref:pentatricopeptide repeat-containing protein At2g44880 n=1 Tax=Rutidosis leptorrhynchoides TaxID=125765 RepID=UPI003A9A41FD